MTTTIEAAAPVGSWNEVVTGKSRAFLQLKTRGAILVHVGGAAPAAGSTAGLVLASGEVEEVSLDLLETGDNVYIRSLDDNEAETVLVMHADAVA